MLCQLTRSLECSNILRKNKKNSRQNFSKNLAKILETDSLWFRKILFSFFAPIVFLNLPPFLKKTIDEKKKKLKIDWKWFFFLSIVSNFWNRFVFVLFFKFRNFPEQHFSRFRREMEKFSPDFGNFGQFWSFSASLGDSEISSWVTQTMVVV